MNNNTDTPASGRTSRRKVVIIGGGYTGACIAVQLVRRSTQPLDITVIESRETIGRGLAYSATDPDHRLNAPTFAHTLIPDDAWHFARWCLEHKLPEADPRCLWPDGGMYMRRSDFGNYIEDTVRQHQAGAPSGSSITHLRGKALGLKVPGSGYRVQVAGAGASKEAIEADADMVFVATGNAPARLQALFDPALATHRAVIANPLDTPQLKAVAPQARILLIGGGLTALDVLSTLVRQGHEGEIVVVSRNGLRPKPQAPLMPALAWATTPEVIAKVPAGILIDRILGPAPAHFGAGGETPRLRDWLRILRSKAVESEAAGGTWYSAFDDLRDSVWQLWPRLTNADKRRFMRKLRIWYDVHRFRSPPQNESMVREAEKAGRIKFIAARFQAARLTADERFEISLRSRNHASLQTEVFDALINCTGLDTVAGLKSNPFLASLLQDGRLRIDGCAMGIDVDSSCCAIDAAGRPQPGLRVVGPPTLGSFGDPIGAMYIGTHIHRIMPGVLQALEALKRPVYKRPALRRSS